MIAEPFVAGVVQLTVTCPLDASTVSPVGAPGAAAGVTSSLGKDAGLVPMALVAVTTNA